VQGLAIRLAKALNKLWQRRGTVFLERCHARLAEGISAIRRVLVYVLNNARKHGVRLPRGVPDPYSSGPWFPYWRAHPDRPGPEPPAEPSPVAEIRDLGLVMAHLGHRDRRRRHAGGSARAAAAGRAVKDARAGGAPTAAGRVESGRRRATDLSPPCASKTWP
jgi:hypothetical protein